MPINFILVGTDACAGIVYIVYRVQYYRGHDFIVNTSKN